MEFVSTGLQGLMKIKPNIYGDHRGYFYETYRSDIFKKNGIDCSLEQSNQSSSIKGVIRGLHLQLPPHAQSKLVRVIEGEILDVVVDCRRNSETFGQHYSCILNSKEANMLFVPRGFAHGFAALEDSVFHYLCDGIYHKESEAGILWNDPQLQIDWKISDPIISEKDLLLPSFEDFNRMNTFQ